jgi:hypothetical protein
MKSNFAIIGVILALVVFLSMFCDCETIEPYSKDTLFPTEYLFEAMTNYFNVREGMGCGVNKEGLIDKKKQSSAVEGFQGLYEYPLEYGNSIDIFSKADTRADCISSSSGLSKSTGPLCLTDEMKTLLSTRGGNLSKN